MCALISELLSLISTTNLPVFVPKGWGGGEGDLVGGGPFHGGQAGQESCQVGSLCLCLCLSLSLPFLSLSLSIPLTLSLCLSFSLCLSLSLSLCLCLWLSLSLSPSLSLWMVRSSVQFVLAILEGDGKNFDLVKKMCYCISGSFFYFL